MNGKARVGASRVAGRAARRLHDEQHDRQRPRRARGVLGKAQLLFDPGANWETRLILSGERARDGDYALQRSRRAARQARSRRRATSRASPHRDVFDTTVCTALEGARVALTTTTGFVNWKTEDATDLDYTPLPLVAPQQRRRSLPVHAGSARRVRGRAPVAPVGLLSLALAGGRLPLHAELRPGRREQLRAVRAVAVRSPSPSIRRRRRPSSTIAASAVFGQATVTLERAAGPDGRRALRSREQGRALRRLLRRRSRPATPSTRARTFSNVSPQFAVAYRVAARQDCVCRSPARLQGRRLQSRVAAGQRESTTRSTPGTSRAA